MICGKICAPSKTQEQQQFMASGHQTYFHPYDIDVQQERFMHPDLGNRRHLNMLMYVGRKKVFSRLERLHGLHPFLAYNEYVSAMQRSGSISLSG